MPCITDVPFAKDFWTDNMKNAGLMDVSVSYDCIDVADILDIHNYLMKKTRYKIYFGDICIFYKNVY